MQSIKAIVDGQPRALGKIVLFAHSIKPLSEKEFFSTSCFAAVDTAHPSKSEQAVNQSFRGNYSNTAFHVIETEGSEINAFLLSLYRP
jgi:hypothetical protein